MRKLEPLGWNLAAKPSEHFYPLLHQMPQIRRRVIQKRFRQRVMLPAPREIAFIFWAKANLHNFDNPLAEANGNE